MGEIGVGGVAADREDFCDESGRSLMARWTGRVCITIWNLYNYGYGTRRWMALHSDDRPALRWNRLS